MVGGEIAKYGTLPIEFLLRLGNDIQNLIYTLARFEIITAPSIDLNNFKLDLVGFDAGEGYVVLHFAYTRQIQTLLGTNVEEQRDIVSQSFNQVMQVANKGNYTELKTVYPLPYKRNHITEALFELVSGLGNTPVFIVEQNQKKSKPNPIYRINPFKNEVRSSLLTQIIPVFNEEVEERMAYARVKVTTKGGKIKNRIQEVFNADDTSLSYAPHVIVCDNRTYTLDAPLRCLFEKENDYYIIQSELLGIMGTGNTEDEAEISFAQEFDFIFTRYNQLPFAKLSEKQKKVKIMLDFLVTQVVGEASQANKTSSNSGKTKSQPTNS